MSLPFFRFSHSQARMIDFPSVVMTVGLGNAEPLFMPLSESGSVSTALSGNVTVTFDKEWHFYGSDPFSGKVLAELKLEKRNGNWQIVSEQDLQVYWTEH